MLTVGFIVTPGFPVMSLAALSVFEFANESSGKKLYDVKILSDRGGPIATALGTNVDTIALGDSHFDTLIIGGNTRATATSPTLLDYLKAASKNSRRISSICTGVFALADAGLLENRRVTTHWLFTDELKARFSEIQLEINRIFVIDGSIWTAAGNSAGVDLTLCMLERDYGSDLARSVGRILVIDHQRSGGQSQHSALLEMNPKSDRIQSAIAYARQNLRKTLSVEKLAQQVNLSPRQFSRAFRTETGMSPAKAIESLRLESASLMLAKTRHPIDEIAVETGFGNEERMRSAFVRAFGRAPQAIRRATQAGAQFIDEVR